MNFNEVNQRIENGVPFALVQGRRKDVQFDIVLDSGFPFTVSANLKLSPFEFEYALELREKHDYASGVMTTGFVKFSLEAYDEGGDIDDLELRVNLDSFISEIAQIEYLIDDISDAVAFYIYEYLLDTEIVDGINDEIQEVDIRSAVYDRVTEFFEDSLDVIEL